MLCYAEVWGMRSMVAMTTWWHTKERMHCSMSGKWGFTFHAIIPQWYHRESHLRVWEFVCMHLCVGITSIVEVDKFIPLRWPKIPKIWQKLSKNGQIPKIQWKSPKIPKKILKYGNS